MSLKTISPDQVTYYALNNEINIPVNDQIPLNKDKEALQAFLTENVAPNTMQFDSLADRLKYLVDNHYYEADFLNKYQPAFFGKTGSISFSAAFSVQILHGRLQILCAVCLENR